MIMVLECLNTSIIHDIGIVASCYYVAEAQDQTKLMGDVTSGGDTCETGCNGFVEPSVHVCDVH